MIKTKDLRACNKLVSVSKDSQKIGDFLYWLKEEKHISLCTLERVEGEQGYWPTGYTVQKLLEEYFGVNPNKVEDERRELLRRIRISNGRRK